MSYITFEHVERSYGTGEQRIIAVDDVSLRIGQGELCVIVGPSGAGKTTILNLLGGMDRVSRGNIVVDGRSVSALNDHGLTAYRREDVGFVFQFYNLMPGLTALENVELAKQIVVNPLDAMETLEAVGLRHRANNFPGQLSGGEQQRVSIARALAKNPVLLLCDEPTGALDTATGSDVLALLVDVARNRGKTVVIITHNTALTPIADRVISIKNGKVDGVGLNDSPAAVEDISW